MSKHLENRITVNMSVKRKYTRVVFHACLSPSLPVHFDESSRDTQLRDPNIVIRREGLSDKENFVKTKPQAYEINSMTVRSIDHKFLLLLLSY